MGKARNLADLLDDNGDVKSASLDNVPASNNASALTTGTLPIARIADDAITNAKLATGITASKLTGDLPAISGANLTGISSVGGATGVDFNDNVKIRMGTSNNLEILHSGSQANIDNATGNLLLTSAGIISLQKGSSEYLARFHPDGAAELYYNNTKTFETMDGGAKVYGTFQNLNVAEASTNIASSAKTVTISGLHTLNPGNHWDRASVWMWLTGTSGDYNHTTSKHWRHECQVIGPWELGSAVEVYGGTPPTTATVTSGSNNSTLQFTVTQPAGNAALRVMVFGHSLSSNCKITFS